MCPAGPGGLQPSRFTLPCPRTCCHVSRPPVSALPPFSEPPFPPSTHVPLSHPSPMPLARLFLNFSTPPPRPRLPARPPQALCGGRPGRAACCAGCPSCTRCPRTSSRWCSRRGASRVSHGLVMVVVIDIWVATQAPGGDVAWARGEGSQCGPPRPPCRPSLSMLCRYPVCLPSLHMHPHPPHTKQRASFVAKRHASFVNSWSKAARCFLPVQTTTAGWWCGAPPTLWLAAAASRGRACLWCCRGCSGASTSRRTAPKRCGFLLIYEVYKEVRIC
jgi:hypothetical protein